VKILAAAIYFRVAHIFWAAVTSDIKIYRRSSHSLSASISDVDFSGLALISPLTKVHFDSSISHSRLPRGSYT
jgi:hypothetical protein